jgi:hypothetical protein
MAWWLRRDDTLAATITMKFLTFIDNDFISRNATTPLTEFNASAYPSVTYTAPDCSALILRAALYANMAGGASDVTFRIIHKCLAYLRSRYISSGVMAGSWSQFQPTFVVTSVTYNEYMANWHSDIIIAISELIKYRDQLTYPSCDTSLS